MIDKGRHPVLGVRIDAVDYEAAVERLIGASLAGHRLAASALAVHGVMTGYLDPTHRRRLNGLDLAVPDGQPVRWALRWLHGIRLPDRVYGPELTLRLVERGTREGIAFYLYGSTPETLERLRGSLGNRFPGVRLAGMQPSRFRRLSASERNHTVEEILASGAQLVLVGLGCPRQETWVFEYRDRLEMPLVAVGAAFDFIAGSVPQAPRWMQSWGLEWLFRLAHEPRRLWRRYLILNPLFLAGVFLEASRIKHVPVLEPDGAETFESFG